MPIATEIFQEKKTVPSVLDEGWMTLIITNVEPPPDMKQH